MFNTNPIEGELHYILDVEYYWDSVIKAWKKSSISSIINANKTIYVSTAGSDNTGTGTLDKPFATPHKALDYLGNKTFKNNITITISVLGGEYNFASPIIINHFQASQINIIGANLIGSKPEGVWYVPIDGPYDNGSSNKFICSGQAIGNTLSDKIINLDLIRTRFSTIFNFSNTNGIIIENSMLNSLDNIAILSDGIGDYSGLVLGSTSKVGGVLLGVSGENCNIDIFSWGGSGIYSENSSISLDGVQIGHCNIGINDKNSFISINESNTSLLNSAEGLILQNSVIDFNLPHIYGMSDKAITLKSVSIDNLLAKEMIGNKSLIKITNSKLEGVKAPNIKYNDELIDIGSSNSKIFFEGIFGEGNSSLDASLFNDLIILFDELDPNISFMQPFGEYYNDVYFGQRGIEYNRHAASSIISEGTLTGNLSGISNVNEALEIIDVLELVSLSELQKVDEGNGFGYRILGVNETYYGPIGLEAIDFSISNISNDILGATGTGSFATGYQVEALGLYSNASGYNTKASGEASSASGYNTTASGTYSRADGFNTLASSDNSHAEGRDTIASGSHSYAGGFGSKSLGNSSHASGIGTISLNEGSFSLGKYNIGSSETALIEVGIGNSSIDRHNALEVHVGGEVLAPSLSMDLILNSKSLITKEFLENSILSVIEESNQNIYISDMILSNYFEYTITENSSISPLNFSKGFRGEIIIKQDEIGGWQVDFDNKYIFPNGIPSLDTTPNRINFFRYTVVDTVFSGGIDKILIEYIADL